MKLVDLTIENFMPYKGKHRLAFPSDASRNVLLVYGDNMRGKTSLLNSIRWCLYGQALDRDLRAIGLPDIANMDARSEGDWSFSVFLKFEAGGHQYDLRRVAKPRDFIRNPRHDSDYDVEVSLSRDSVAIVGDQIEHEINQLMPEQISRFFLFDAELLAEYQGLLIEDSEQGKRIKEAIEQVLGVPALIHGRDEFRTLLKKAQAVLAKENKHTEGMKAQAEQFTKLQTEIEALAEDLERLEQKEEQYRSEIAQLDGFLSQTEAAQRAQARIDGLRAEARRLGEREQALSQERRELASAAWRDLLQPRLRAHLATLVKERNAFQEQIERRGSLSTRIKQLQAVLTTSTCAVCEQAIAPEQRERFGRDLGRLEVELDEISSNIHRVGTLSSEIERLSKITGTGAAQRFTRIDTELSRNAVELVRIETELENLNEAIRGFDTAEVARQRSRRDQIQVNLGRLLEDIRRTKRDMDERQSKQNHLSRMMSKAPEARTQRSAREVEIYGELEKLFGRGVDVLRDRLRESVAQRAAEAFLKITTEQTYSGLRINNNYGLTIIDRESRPVEVRSAGAEQVVALSLIDGLNRTARKAGPIIIDTPLGRLDPRHRANVLAFLPTMADQVVLLVHEGEIDRSTGLEPLKTRIGGVYEIERISSSHSELRKS